jgi:hypothetical protein
VTTPNNTGFDFQAFRSAIEPRDTSAWAEFYADDAEWLEYKHGYPPSSPRRMSGRVEIEAFLSRVAASGVELKVSDEVVGAARAASARGARCPMVAGSSSTSSSTTAKRASSDRWMWSRGIREAASAGSR